ncbi:MAG: response regulator [Proteobacteria bacterium]|nr:response regulator [Desulfobulbaceae bacterium]MBU4152680.1 response regulator [Pseudomonadota bacterium]
MLQEKIRAAIGGTTRIATSGQDGLEAILAEPPDLILLDIRMPGIDGFEVCRLLKSSPGTALIPIIFLSATYNDLRSRIKGLDLGADDFMVHPVDDLEMVTRVKAILQIKELRDQLASLQDTQGNLRAQHSQLQQRLASCCTKMLSFCQGGSDGMLSITEIAKEARTQLAFVNETITGNCSRPNQPLAGSLINKGSGR